MAEDSTERSSNKKTSVVNNRRKIMLGAIVAAIVAVMTTGIASTQNSIAQIEGENPSQGYDIHVTVNRHDSMNLNAPMDHYCKKIGQKDHRGLSTLRKGECSHERCRTSAIAS